MIPGTSTFDDHTPHKLDGNLSTASDNIMQADSRYSIGYEHGISQARPIVDLEHRVKDIGSRVKMLTWGFSTLAAISLLNFILKLPKLFKGKGKDKGKEHNKGKENNEGRRNGTVNGQKFRRHARAFKLYN